MRYTPSSNPSANPNESSKVKAKRKSKLRAIDQGTYRDLTGSLRRLTRQIDRGEFGKVRDVSVILSTENGGGVEVKGWHFGAGSRADVHWMIATAKNRLEPA